MSEILHNKLADAIAKCKAGDLPGVFLVHGQEMLVEQAVERLSGGLLAGASRDLCCDTMDGLMEKIPDLLAQMNTFSLLSEPKIIVFKDVKLLEGRGADQRLAEQIIDACESEDLDQAAKSLVSLCGQQEMDIAAASQSPPVAGIFNVLHEQVGLEGIEKIVQYALAQGLRPAGSGHQMQTLLAAVEKGFADRHHMIITATSKVPKNLKIYKAIANHGWIIDCNVPMGERRADRTAQESVLRQAMENQLAAAGKLLQNGVFEATCQLTGFDLRTFSQNIAKLIDYTGARKEICVADVHKVLKRTKSDPVFELTNAVADRNLKQALFYLQTLLAGDLYPLQILSALGNQIRRLLIAKDFTLSTHGKSWTKGMSYQQFQHSVMPAVQAFDNQLRQMTAQWDTVADDSQKSKPGGAKSKAGHEIAVASNPNNPYPVYQTLLKSEKYTRQELLGAMAILNRADLRLKSTGQDTHIVLKKTIIDVCG